MKIIMKIQKYFLCVVRHQLYSSVYKKYKIPCEK